MSGVPYSNDTTSKAAATAMATTGKAVSQRDLVLDMLRQHPNGMTDHGIAHAVGIGQRQASTRRKQLEREGRVRDSGRTTIGPCGVPNIVWQAHDGEPATKMPPRIRTRTALRGYRERVQKMIAGVVDLAPSLTNHPEQWRGWMDACDEIKKRLEVIE